MNLTIEQLEAARKAGAIIIANEARHGRPREWHIVGTHFTKPEYSCTPAEYDVVWPVGVNVDREWKPAGNGVEQVFSP